MNKENIDKSKVMKEIKKVSPNLYELQEQVNEWAEGSMAQSPIYEVGMVEKTENEKEIAKEIMKQLIDNYQTYKKQVRESE